MEDKHMKEMLSIPDYSRKAHHKCYEAPPHTSRKGPH